MKALLNVVILAATLASVSASASPFGSFVNAIESCTGQLDQDNEITIFAIPFRNAKSGKKVDSFILLEQTANKLDGSSIVTSFTNTSRVTKVVNVGGKTISETKFSNNNSGMSLTITTGDNDGGFVFGSGRKALYVGGSVAKPGISVECN